MAIGPFSFDADDRDKWIIPGEILAELKEVEEGTGLRFGPPSKKLVNNNTTRKQSRKMFGPGREKKRKYRSEGPVEENLSNFDRKKADGLLIQIAESLTKPQMGSRTRRSEKRRKKMIFWERKQPRAQNRQNQIKRYNYFDNTFKQSMQFYTKICYRY